MKKFILIAAALFAAIACNTDQNTNSWSKSIDGNMITVNTSTGVEYTDNATVTVEMKDITKPYFNLSIEGLGKYSALASGMFMTMVVGGGVLPLVQNACIDPAVPASYMASYWIIVAALAYMLWFALLGSRVKTDK